MVSPSKEYKSHLIYWFLIKVTSNMQLSSKWWWIQFIVASKSKVDNPKEKFGRFSTKIWCHQFLMIVMIRYCRTVLFDEECGRGHPVLIYIKRNRILQELKRRMEVLRIILGYDIFRNPLKVDSILN